MSPLRLLYLPFLFFAFSCTPQGLHRLRISACAPLCSIRAALHKATADSSHSEASFEITSARELIIMSLLLGFEYFCTLMSGSFLFGRCSVAFLCSLICWRMFSCEPRDESLRQDILTAERVTLARLNTMTMSKISTLISTVINSNFNSIHISYAQICIYTGFQYSVYAL